MKNDLKVMLTITAGTVKDLVLQANKKQIQKEDIVSLFCIKEQYILVYYSK